MFTLFFSLSSNLLRIMIRGLLAILAVRKQFPTWISIDSLAGVGIPRCSGGRFQEERGSQSRNLVRCSHLFNSWHNPPEILYYFCLFVSSPCRVGTIKTPVDNQSLNGKRGQIRRHGNLLFSKGNTHLFFYRILLKSNKKCRCIFWAPVPGFRNQTFFFFLSRACLIASCSVAIS